VAGKQLGERPAVHHLHDDEGGPVLLLHYVDGHDVGMVDGGEGLDLLPQARQGTRRSVRGPMNVPSRQRGIRGRGQQ